MSSTLNQLIGLNAPQSVLQNKNKEEQTPYKISSNAKIQEVLEYLDDPLKML